MDETGDLPKVIVDKRIHDKVLENICNGNQDLSWKKTCIYYNSANWSGGWGFCDLYNKKTGEVWELKKDSSSFSCSIPAATVQLNKYIHGRLKYDLDLPLKLPYETNIEKNTFSCYISNACYTITYWYEGSGILRYQYYTLDENHNYNYIGVVVGAILSVAAALILGPAGCGVPVLIPA